MTCNNHKQMTRKYYRMENKKNVEQEIRDYFSLNNYKPIRNIYYNYNSDLGLNDDAFDKKIKSRLEKIAENETEPRKEDSKILRKNIR